MNIILLTTKTYHHLYFYREISKNFKNIKVIIEKKKINFGFKIKHKLYDKRDKYEKKFFFQNKNYLFKQVKSFQNVNSNKCSKYINNENPDIIICFGIGILKKKFLKFFKSKIIVNLHGGNPTEYRGLDSFFWSIYHNDFANLISTLHYVDNRIDTGKIIDSKKIFISKKTKLEHLRAINTLICVDLVKKFLKKLKRKKKIKSSNNKKKGRYYSAFPAILMDRCQKNFDNNLKKLKK